MEHMKARFIGTDGSMGLVRGRVYDIQLRPFCDYIYVYWDFGACPYSNFEAFEKNWEIVYAVYPITDNESLGDMILSLAENGYQVRFCKTSKLYRLTLFLEKCCPDGSIICKQRHLSLDGIDGTTSRSRYIKDTICYKLKCMRKEFEESMRMKEINELIQKDELNVYSLIYG